MTSLGVPTACTAAAAFAGAIRRAAGQEEHRQEGRRDNKYWNSDDVVRRQFLGNVTTSSYRIAKRDKSAS